MSSLYKHPYVKKDCFKKYFCDITDNLLSKCDDLIFMFDGNLTRDNQSQTSGVIVKEAEFKL